MTGRYITEFSSEGVRADQIHIELEGIEGYKSALTGSDVVEVLFEEEPDESQIDQVDAILAAHVPGSLDVKVHRYIPSKRYNVFEPPLEVSYTFGLTIGLYRVVEDTELGDPTLVSYYAEAQQDEDFDTTYSDLIVQESIEYTRNILNVIKKTITTISWVKEDDSLHPTTKTITTYS